MKKSFQLATWPVALVMLLSLSACTDAAAVNTAQSSFDQSLRLYKSANCACCSKWAEHMQSAGFEVEVINTQQGARIKSQLGVAPAYRSCHSAVGQGYVFEGHIRADLVKRFLLEKPANAIGLSVPGMPLGSPGMEVAEQLNPYQVWLLKTDGNHEIYAQVGPAGTTITDTLKESHDD